MRKILIGIVIAFIMMFSFKYCQDKKEERMVIKESSTLIQEQIKNVGKLIVTEGHYSQVFTYKNSKALFANLFNVEKKALVVVNADVTIAYDLSKLEYVLDEKNKELTITFIPEQEINIHPDFEYYDVQADYLNPFEANDYNTIKETVRQSLMKKVEASNLKSNAQNRLLSELAKFYILTNSLGWTLKYNQEVIQGIDQFEQLPALKK
ncbi:MAG TPA: DUF4230 domain-containing protein [Xanthomarina sp.]|nr:DUF4230 domain-containing protein [Xanthomarina sp.]